MLCPLWNFSNRRQFVLTVLNYTRLGLSWMVGCNAGVLFIFTHHILLSFNAGRVFSCQASAHSPTRCTWPLSLHLSFLSSRGLTKMTNEKGCLPFVLKTRFFFSCKEGIPLFSFLPEWSENCFFTIYPCSLMTWAVVSVGNEMEQSFLPGGFQMLHIHLVSCFLKFCILQNRRNFCVF